MSIWYPFTQMAELSEHPMLEIVGGRGNFLIDKSGKEYFDGISSLWTNVHGHCHPFLNQAIKAQVDRISHSTLLGLSHDRAEELASALIKVSPKNLTKVFYSDSGSTAVEIALKQSFQYWKLSGNANKCRFVKLENSYHGDTLGAVTVGGIPIFHHVFGPLLKDSFTLKCPVTQGGQADQGAEALAQLEELLSEKNDEIAALIMEPSVLGAGGILIQPAGFTKAAAKLCKEHNVHLILDEVATGFGRTGKMFACEEGEIEPDFLCLGKGITGGYLPLAATLTTSSVFDEFLSVNGELKTFFHGHTYTGNPLACAAGIASLELFEKENTLENVRLRAQDLARELKELHDHQHVLEIRQKGLMCGIEVCESKNPLKAFDENKKMGRRIALKARTHGVILRNLGDVVVLMPPLSSSKEEIKLLCDGLKASIDECV